MVRDVVEEEVAVSGKHVGSKRVGATNLSMSEGAEGETAGVNEIPEDDGVAELPEKIPLYPDVRNNRSSPEATRSSLAEFIVVTKVILLERRPEDRKATIEDLPPADGGLLSEERVIARRV